MNTGEEFEQFFVTFRVLESFVRFQQQLLVISQIQLRMKPSHSIIGRPRTSHQTGTECPYEIAKQQCSRKERPFQKYLPAFWLGLGLYENATWESFHEFLRLGAPVYPYDVGFPNN